MSRRSTVFFRLLFLIAYLAGTPPSILYGQVSLRDKIGQMLMLGFSGSTLDDTIRTDLATRNLGGVILMGGNCLSPQQIRQLTASINTAATTPPFIATDQEGGLVARLNLNNGYAKTYTEYQLGSYFASLDSTSAQATRMAGWMSDAGMSVDLAPVVDVDVNPSSP
ncbi:MAG: glycoside hydrolase family 3 N-terminal domain-containing protein, partial [Bacteroidota bacterium]